MMRRAAVISGLLLILPLLAASTSASGASFDGHGERSPAMSQSPMVLAEASCASLCRQRHNQCRISTRGAPRCDADLQRCLKDCLASKRRSSELQGIR
jgi:hypothetical protein